MYAAIASARLVREPIDHGAEVPDTAIDVFARVERVAHAQDGCGLRHELHESLGALWRHRPGIEARLGPDHRGHQLDRDLIALGGVLDLALVLSALSACGRRSQPAAVPEENFIR